MLRTARAAVLGLDITTGEPQLIVQAAVYYVDGGLVTSGALSYWSRPDVPRHEVPTRCWPSLHQAPTWSETADRLVELIGDRVLVLHDLDRWQVLRRHLPDWQPAGLVLTRNLAEHAWPGLADHSLGQISADGGLPFQPGAVVEAHVIALLVGRLLSSDAGSP